MSTVKQEIEATQQRLLELEAQLDQERANKLFQCACGKKHRIKNCDVIQTHWYTEPHGCMGGDYWNEGELQIVCPNDPTFANRVLYHSYYMMPYDKRDVYAHNAEKQFNSMYKRLFKSVIDDRKYEHDYRTVNSYYIDDNHKKFDIDIGFPYSPKKK